MMEKKQISRRSFIKGLAAGSLGMAAGAVLPGAALAQEKAPAGVPGTWDEEADVVVIGFGGSGSIAAIEATRQGASVIVLEKSEGRVGGNLALSSGTLHDSCGCDVDEWTRLYQHGTLRCGATAEEIRPVLETASRANEWVSDYNLTFMWFDQETAGTTWPKHQIEGQASGMGPALWAEIDAEAQRLGVDVRTSTAARRLIQNPETKEILGVIAVNAQGSEKTFKARKGVIMACGGYEHNAEMFYHYNIPGIDLTPVAHAIPTNTGDGFPMAMEVGAQLWHMNTIHFGGLSFPQPSKALGHAVEAGMMTLGGGGKQGAECACPWICIDRNGKRFMNESFIWAHDQNHKEAFDFSTAAAFSKKTFGAFSPQVMKYTDRVSEYIHLPMFIVFGQEMFDMERPLMSGTASNQEALDKGWIVKGDTIEELAAKLHGEAPCGFEEDAVDGVDPEALRQTLTTWNGYAAVGEDPEFLRDPAHVLPLPEEGPFYGCEVSWSLDFTEGGPKRNGRCQTIDVWGNPIPRLYNTGEFGSYNTTVYCIGGVLQALTTGRIAGADAASLEDWA